ncbi:hypothetical protein, partial [Flavobacterium glaciei]
WFVLQLQDTEFQYLDQYLSPIFFLNLISPNGLQNVISIKNERVLCDNSSQQCRFFLYINSVISIRLKIFVTTELRSDNIIATYQYPLLKRYDKNKTSF